MKLQQLLQKSTSFLEVVLAAQISASQELREVPSCHSKSQPRGPPFLNTIPPLMLRNLKSGRKVPSATVVIIDVNDDYDPGHLDLASLPPLFPTNMGGGAPARILGQ